jgi:hypothetical protein
VSKRYVRDPETGEISIVVNNVEVKKTKSLLARFRWNLQMFLSAIG